MKEGVYMDKFSRTAVKTRKINIDRPLFRGGFRL